ncbi:TPA: type II toxin-antitoxin system RelB/DinJ family antitoxin [Enterococcus faecium]
MTTNEKKRVQVQIDKHVVDDVEAVFNELGLTATTAITMFYKRVAGEGKIPFEVALTEREKDTLNFLKNTSFIEKEELKTTEDIEDWLNDDGWE